MLDWANISTVLLDMDGTILDLHFDNQFWSVHLPLRYSQQAQISIEQAKHELQSHYQKIAGTLNWYCLDYWTEQTKLPIQLLKREIQDLICLRADAHNFLTALRDSGREIVLVTNAHPDSLSLKIERTQLDKYFDSLYSCHQFGVTKESQLLWQKLQQEHPFDLANTLFVDDSLPVLESARTFGFNHLLAIENPDSQQPKNNIKDFNSISDYGVLLQDIRNNPVINNKC
jgi:HAD superfamily hydrolase (TIGR01509 family)